MTGSVLDARGSPRARAVVLGSRGVLFLISPLFYALAVARHRESFSAIIPVIVFVVLVGALWPYRQRAAGG